MPEIQQDIIEWVECEHCGSGNTEHLENGTYECSDCGELTETKKDDNNG